MYANILLNQFISHLDFVCEFEGEIRGGFWKKERRNK